MMRRFLLALPLIVPALPGAAQDFGCSTNVHQQLFEITGKARAAEVTPADAGQAVTEVLQGCGRNRVVFAQLLELFTVAGLTREPPDAMRFGSHANALRAVDGAKGMGSKSFAPVTLVGPDGAAFEWGTIDERNAYWDLMFALSADFLVFGVHADLYTPGRIERIGCGLYPAEEASALAAHAADNVDGGELLARVSFLGRECDTPESDTSGYAALYFAKHLHARAADPDYVGLTEGDIRSGLHTFLAKHLDGAPESDLFTAAEVAEFTNF
jgi:hypothetical protein